MEHLCYFCLVLLCFHARLFVDALWSPAGKGLAFWLSFVMSYSMSIGILGQVWCLILSIPGLCPLSYFDSKLHAQIQRGGGGQGVHPLHWKVTKNIVF